MPRLARPLVAAAWLLCAAASPAQELPAAVRDALVAAALPDSALAAVVLPLDAGEPRLAWQPQRPMNPGSVTKLVTAAAALELLGPAYRWPTPVWLQGRLRHGVLHGDLVLRGLGDPRFTAERLWLLLRRVQQWGVRQIRGDIVLDRSAFAPPLRAPGDFDQQPLKPYNVQADALLLADKTVLLTFTPDPLAGVARVQVLPTLDGLKVPTTVPLAGGPCGDWVAALDATPQDPRLLRLSGHYPGACGERTWALAHPEPAQYDARLVLALWRELGGRLDGRVRDGSAPQAPPSFVDHSAPLARLLPDILKNSLNAAAQQLWLTMAREANAQRPADDEQARAVVRQWLRQRLGEAPADEVVLDNGSGLSRTQRFSADTLAQLLRQWAGSPLAPELWAALPLNGVDGTLRRSQATPGRAHLKTGSLNEVAALAGLVHGRSGRSWVLVALVNDPQAGAARAALDALVQWAIDDL